MTQALTTNPYDGMGIEELSREHLKLGASILSLYGPSWRRKPILDRCPLVSFIPLHLQDELLLLGVRFKELLIGECSQYKEVTT